MAHVTYIHGNAPFNCKVALLPTDGSIDTEYLLPLTKQQAVWLIWKAKSFTCSNAQFYYADNRYWAGGTDSFENFSVPNSNTIENGNYFDQTNERSIVWYPQAFSKQETHTSGESSTESYAYKDAVSVAFVPGGNNTWPLMAGGFTDWSSGMLYDPNSGYFYMMPPRASFSVQQRLNGGYPDSAGPYSDGDGGTIVTCLDRNVLKVAANTGYLTVSFFGDTVHQNIPMVDQTATNGGVGFPFGDSPTASLDFTDEGSEVWSYTADITGD